MRVRIRIKRGNRAADTVNQSSNFWANTDEQIQVENKERLNGANHSKDILDGEVPVIEVPVDSIFDQFIIAMVLAFGRKRMRPMRTSLQLTTGVDGHFVH